MWEIIENSLNTPSTRMCVAEKVHPPSGWHTITAAVTKIGPSSISLSLNEFDVIWLHAYSLRHDLLSPPRVV